MREAIVAVFDSAPHTAEAVHALHEAGIPQTEIRQYHKGDPLIPPTATGTAARAPVPGEEPHRSPAGFWSWLTGNAAPEQQSGYEHDYGAYNRAVEAGNTVLAVTVEDTEASRVMDVLEARSPLELEDTGPAGDGAARAAAPATPDLALRSAPAAAASTPSTPVHGEQRIPLAEERLSVGKRVVDHGTTRIHRYVVEQPVEQQVNLRQDRVAVERRRPIEGSAAADPHAFEERTVEVREQEEEPVVSKRTAVPEEVVVRHETTEHPATVRDTVRKEEVRVDKPRQG